MKLTFAAYRFESTKNRFERERYVVVKNRRTFHNERLYNLFLSVYEIKATDPGGLCFTSERNEKEELQYSSN